MNNNNNFSDNNPKGKQTGNVKRKFNYNWIYLLLFAVFFVMWFMNSSDRPKDITCGKLRQLIVEQKVDKIIIVNKENAEIFLKLDSLAAKDKGGKKAQSKGADFIINVGSLETFEKNLMEAQANIPEDQRIYPQYETRKNWGLDLLGYLIPFILLLALWFLLMRMMSKGSGGAGGQIFNIGKSKAQLFDKDTHVNVTFDDVAGLEGAKL